MKTDFKVSRGLILLILIILAFGAGFSVSYFKQQVSQSKPVSAVVHLPTAESLPVSKPDDDAIGDFILHHEYFAADPEVLEDSAVSAIQEAAEIENEIEPSLEEETPPSEPETIQQPKDSFKEEAAVSKITEMTDEKTEKSVHASKRKILDKIEIKRPLVAIVIDDMGINQKRTKDIITLKAPLTSSFLTYGNHLAALAEQAEHSGHEIMIHAPMEPKVKADLAPDTLLVDMNEAQIETTFEQMLNKFNQIRVSGINNHMGSRFTEDKTKLGYVMAVLKQQKMFFLDSKTTASSKGKELAEADGVDYAARDVFLDNENDYQYIMQQLEKTEKIAARKGFAIAICHPKSQTFLALQDWLTELENKNIQLVHVSEIVAKINQ